MNQTQFDLICKIVTSGAPALANELLGALEAFVKSYNEVVAENEQLKAAASASDVVKAAETIEE